MIDLQQNRKNFIVNISKKLDYHVGTGLITDLCVSENASQCRVEVSFQINLKFDLSEYLMMHLKEMLFWTLENALIDAQAIGLTPVPPATKQGGHCFDVNWETGTIRQVYRY